jgi:putative tributyrin esterase
VPRERIERVSVSDTVTVTDVRIPSAAVGVLWYRAIVPNMEPSGRLPVLYFLHGADSDPARVMNSSSIAKLAVENRLIVVLPDGKYSYFTNAKYKSGARWEDAVTQELPRDVEARFPALTGREHTGIAGISMGGYGAVKIAMKHPEQYAFAGTMSGALDVTRRSASFARMAQTLRLWRIFGFRVGGRSDEDVFDLLRRSSAVKETRWFASCGEKDPLYEVNARFARRMQERGVEMPLRSTPGGHAWDTWNAVLPELFKSAAEGLGAGNPP